MSEKVAIIYSPGFGAGWSTWGEPEQALDQELAKAIVSGDIDKIKEVAKRNWSEEYDGGLMQCEVKYVDFGTPFRIEEYDGSESLILESDFRSAVPWEGSSK